MIYHTLQTELICPARIIFGYNGFKTQKALRESFVKFLSDQGNNASGYGVYSLPSLISCGNHSLVKANGMPFCSPIQEDGCWPVYGSITGNPLELLLEIIWTRLVYDDKLSGEVFHDSGYIQSLNRFIDAKLVKSGERTGWMYQYVDASEEQLTLLHEPVQWEPVTLDEAQYSIVNLLCHEEKVDVSKKEFIDFINKYEYSSESFVQAIKKTGLVGCDGDLLVLLTRNCVCAMLPDGRLVAGENIAGQFEEWMNRYLDNRKDGTFEHI